MAQPHSGRSYVVTLPSGGRVRMRYLDLGTIQRVRQDAFRLARDTPALAPTLAGEKLTEASIVEISVDVAADLKIDGEQTSQGFVPVDDAAGGRRLVYARLDQKDRDMLDIAYAKKNALSQEEADPLLAAIVDEA